MKVSKKIMVTAILGRDTARVPLPVVLVYDTDDPCVVALEFYTGQHHVNIWHVARDVIAKAVFSRKTAGELSFVLNPVTDEGLPKVVACMTPPDQGRKVHQHVMFVNRDLQLFLYDTFDQVPLGDEDYTQQVDAALEKILNQ